MFLFKPAYLVRFTADFLNTFEKVSSVISIQSLVLKDNSSDSGSNNGSLWLFEKRFHGQTSWQVSQPNVQSSKRPLKLAGIASFNSIVKYEIHLDPSTIFGATIACVGHASTQAVQLPQWSVVTGWSYSNSKSRMISAKKKKEPFCLLIRLAFLATHPRPDFCAQDFSNIGAESTKTRPSIPPNSCC